MIVVGLLLAVVAFIEAAVFFYLRDKVRRVAAATSAASQYQDRSKVLFEEASTRYSEAHQMYDEAKWLVVQAKTGEIPRSN